MTNFPDFTPHGYRAVKEVGRNNTGFRTTYKAVSLLSDQLVIVKHFESVPNKIDDWNALEKMYTEEIQALQGLKHSNIPYFIESFKMEDRSRCIVLEYKSGQTLAESRSFSPDEIKVIALSLLDILIYLQDQIPPIKHRDIKPENVLVEGTENHLKVYLVDFGFARIGDGEARTASSMIKGTLGFIAPEQRRNQPLTNSSDLYGLGATLICLVTGIKSSEIDNLTDNHNRIKFKELVPGFSLRFIEWLEKVVEPDPSQRYPDAKTALEALKPLYVRRIPEANLSHSTLELKASKLGEKLTQIITIKNSVPETLLEGSWRVSAHPNDFFNTSESYEWISITPAHFQGNHVDFIITIDSKKLIADSFYKRELTLQTNSLLSTQTLRLEIKTSEVPVQSNNPPYFELTFILVMSTLSGGIISYAWSDLSDSTVEIVSAIPALFIFPSLRLPKQYFDKAIATILIVSFPAAIASFCEHLLLYGSTHALYSRTGMFLSRCVAILVGIAIGLAFGKPLLAAIYSFHGKFIDKCNKKRLPKKLITSLLALQSFCGLGLPYLIRFSVPNLSHSVYIPWLYYHIASFCIGGILLIILATYYSINHRRLISQYRASEKNLIKP